MQSDNLTVDLRFKTAQILLALGRVKMVVGQLNLVVEAETDNAPALNTLAWILATTDDDAICNAHEAVRLAEKACKLTDHKSPSAMDTLAAALSAYGDFERAIEAAKQASDIAESVGQNKLADEIRERLKLYKQGKRFYDLKLSQEKK